MPVSAALKILFVINPGSGAKTNTNWEEVIAAYFKRLPHAVEYFILSKENPQDALKRRIEKVRPQRVVAVGGDGTVSMVARQLVGTDMAMGILPAGSANGMATELNIPATPVDALNVVINGRVQCCDLIKINNNQICLHLSDIGLNAQLIKYFDEGKLRGKLGYARVILKTLWHKEIMHVDIQTRDKEIKRKAFMVVLANASKYGTGAVINPEGQLHDGYFEVIVVRRLALSELLKMLIKPQPFNPKKIETIQAKAVTIQTLKHVHFQIDGEYMGKVKQVEASILTQQINLMLPLSGNKK